MAALLLCGALSTSAQDTLPVKLLPMDPRLMPAGEQLITAGTHKQVSLACFLASGLIATATASNQSKGTFTERQANGWYTIAGIIGTVGISLQFTGNGKLIKAGKIMATDWNNPYHY